MLTRRYVLGLRILLVVMSLCVSTESRSAVKTWSGGGTDGNWTTVNNWDGGVRPSDGDSLVFSGADRLTNTNDYSLSVTSLLFTAVSGSFKLAGNELIFGGSSNVFLRNSDDEPQMIENNLLCAANLTVDAVSGDLLIEGDVGGSGAAHTLTLQGGVGNDITIGGTVSDGPGGALSLRKRGDEQGNYYLWMHSAGSFATEDTEITEITEARSVKLGMLNFG